MKLIITHDVDLLLTREHYFRDLLLEKQCVRSVLQWLGLMGDRITARECALRVSAPFRRRMNYIDELMAFDRAHGIESSFFFGMAQGLGMSYKPEEARDMMLHVRESGFDIGVHGICYDDEAGIRRERDTFTKLMGFAPDGMRMHYVRFDGRTFERLAQAGYLYDSTEFDKQRGGTVKAPYKVSGMWEFPLCVMDGYLPYELEKAKERTLAALAEGEKKGLSYFTVLFHDPHFGEDYAVYKKWYEWLIEYAGHRYGFVSMRRAAEELEASNAGNDAIRQ